MNLKLNREKCKFLMDSLPYIGHILTKEGVRPDPNKVMAIKAMPAFTDGDEIRRFLGHVNCLA